MSPTITERELTTLKEAETLWAQGQSPTGTKFDRYFRSKGLVLSAWPDEFRFHPASDLLLVKIRGAGQKFAGVRGYQVCTCVTSVNGQKVPIELLSLARNLAVEQFGFTAIKGKAGSNGPVILAANLEEGLATSLSTHREVHIFWEDLKALQPKMLLLTKTYVLAIRDAASPWKGATQTFSPVKRKIRELVRAGMDIRVVEPFTPRRSDGTGIFDAFREFGPTYVAKRIDDAINGHRWDGPTTTLTITHARELLSEVARDIFELHKSTKGTTKFQKGIKVDVGVGKSTAAISQIVNYLRASGTSQSDPFVYFVPTLELADELATKLRKALADAGLGHIGVAVRRGYQANNSEAPGDQRMCRRPDDLKLALSALTPIEKILCNSGESQCQHHATCLYQKQRETRADIWILPHECLFRPKDDYIGTPQFAIIDESFLQSSRDQMAAKLDALLVQPVVQMMSATGGIKNLDQQTADLVAGLWPIRQNLLQALKENGPGPLRAGALVNAGLSSAECRKASGLERMRFVHPHKDLDLTTDSKRFSEIVKVLTAKNSDIPALSMMWTLISDYLEQYETALLEDGRGDFSACGSVEMGRDERGAQTILISHMRPIHQDWDVDTLNLDATMRIGLVKKFLPRLELAACIKVETPFQHDVALTGKSYSYSALHDDDDENDAGSSDNVDGLTGRPKLKKLLDKVKSRAAATDGDTLLIVPKCVEDAIALYKLFLPPHIHVIHHGALTGIDKYGKVNLCIVAGRLLPPSRDIEQIAGEFTGLSLRSTSTVEEPWYPKKWVNAIARDQGVAPIEVVYHPDELCEEIRKSIYEDGIVQAVGRARGVNRTEENPVVVELWNDDLPPFQPDTFMAYIGNSRAETAMGEGWLAQNAADQAKLQPGLGSADAIKQARHRQGLGPEEKGTHFVTPASLQELMRSVTVSNKKHLLMGNVTLLDLDVYRHCHRDLKGGQPDLTEVFPELAHVIGLGCGATLQDPVVTLLRVHREHRLLRHVTKETWSYWLQAHDRGSTEHLDAFLYKKSGPGQKATVASCDTRLARDPTGYLEAKLGSMAECRSIGREIRQALATLGGPIPPAMTQDEIEACLAEFEALLAGARAGTCKPP